VKPPGVVVGVCCTKPLIIDKIRRRALEQLIFGQLLGKAFQAESGAGDGGCTRADVVSRVFSGLTVSVSARGARVSAAVPSFRRGLVIVAAAQSISRHTSPHERANRRRPVSYGRQVKSIRAPLQSQKQVMFPCRRL
jgi:hypothetical protein